MNFLLVASCFPASYRAILTTKKREHFLRALEETANVSMACRSAGIGRRTAYDWREEDADFSLAWERAVEIGTEALRDEVVLRGFHGRLKPVYQGGKLVGSIRERSDALLMFELKRRDPSYRDRFEVTGAHGGPIRHAHEVHFYIPDNGRDGATIQHGELETDNRNQAAAGTARAILSLPG